MQNIDYIKALSLYGQHLTNKTDKRTVVRDLNGLQSQFMSNAFHGLRIRCNEEVTESDFGGGLVKNWTLRGTVHVFAKEDLPLFIRENYRWKYTKKSRNTFLWRSDGNSQKKLVFCLKYKIRC